MLLKAKLKGIYNVVSIDSFLFTGITFSMDGNTPDEKDRLNMSAR